MVARSPRAKSLIAGLTAFAALGSFGYVKAAGGERTLKLYNIHTKESVSVVYKRDGRHIPEALDKINWVLRDWRKNEKTRMDPELVDLLWEIHNELGSKEPIHIISGFRSRATNDMLRASVGGQASESRHILGKAADVHFPDVPLNKLRYSALIRERGGVGYYPTSAIPFVHIDTDRVRHWPRLPRHELALLFPTGVTKHQPADGSPLTREDFRVAKAKYGTLATEIAAFLDFRTGSRTALADAGGKLTPAQERQVVALVKAPAPLNDPLPQLLAPPRPVAKAPPSIANPSLSERALLASLTGAPAPRLVREPQPAVRRTASLGGMAPMPEPAPVSTSAADRQEERRRQDVARLEAELRFSAAPAWDEEHPDELAYRPFPIAPLMTQTASADDPALLHMIAPDATRTLELMESQGTALPLRFRPGEQVAQLMWAQQFAGEAVAINALFTAGEPSPAASQLKNRTVRTSGNR